MTIKYIQFNNFNKKNSHIRYFIPINEVTYIFSVHWDIQYANCGYLSISTFDNIPIINSIALVNGLKIRNNNLPYEFYFIQINGETYEPTIDNIAKEFVLAYEVEDD